MKTSSKLAFGVATAIAGIIGGVGYQHFTSPDLAQQKVKQFEDKEVADQHLGQYAINMMYTAGAGDKLSDAKKLALARSIVMVSNDIFEKVEDRHAFITALAIESGFQRFAQSPTGPKGFSQVAKGTFHGALSDCGMNNVHEDDVWETDLNLYAGACYFREQLEAVGGDPNVAIVRYNQGPNSDAAKNYAKTGNLDNLEALKYVAKFTYLKRKVIDKPMLGVPTINSLQKPSKKK